MKHARWYSPLHGQLMNYIIPKKVGLNKCYKNPPTVQDTFWSIPGFISCAGLTLRWRLLSLVCYGWKTCAITHMGQLPLSLICNYPCGPDSLWLLTFPLWLCNIYTMAAMICCW